MRERKQINFMKKLKLLKNNLEKISINKIKQLNKYKIKKMIFY